MADLESPDPQPVSPSPPAHAAQPSVEPPAPPAPVAGEEDEPEGTVEVSGTKMVPITWLHKARNESKQLKHVVGQAQQVVAWHAENKPYVEFLRAHPDVITRVTTTQAPAAPPADVPDPRAESIARTLDLYTPEGKPDLARAKTLMGVVQEIAGVEAQGAVKPLADMSARERSSYNYSRVLNVQTPDGRRPDPTIVADMWRGVPAEMTANDQIASLITYAALGYQVASGQGPIAPPAHAPLDTEAPGGRTVGRTAPISELDQRIMAARGLDAKKYAELTKGFDTTVRAGVLED